MANIYLKTTEIQNSCCFKPVMNVGVTGGLKSWCCSMYSMMHAKDLVNPLSPNGDQHQFSPHNIHTMSRD